MVMKKEIALYARNDKEELIPQEVVLDIDENDSEQLKLKGETVFVTPMTRGEIKELFANSEMKTEKDLDGELILKHCKNPLYSETDVKFMKPAVTSAIVNTIFRESGLDLKRNTKKKSIQDAEDDFAKNS